MWVEVVTDLNFEPDGEPGPAELSQVRIQQKVVEVNGVAVSSKAEIMAVLHPERLVGGLEIAGCYTRGDNGRCWGNDGGLNNAASGPW